jgi:hypothetical protein
MATSSRDCRHQNVYGRPLKNLKVIHSGGFVEIPYVPADESAVLADGSVLKHALKPASAGFHLLSRMLQHPAPTDVYRATLDKLIIGLAFSTAFMS